MVTPAKKLEDLIHLAELCVDLLQQNEEHYAEVKVNTNTDNRNHVKADFGVQFTNNKYDDLKILFIFNYFTV